MDLGTGGRPIGDRTERGWRISRLVVALALVAVLAGCVGGSYTYAADPAEIDGGALGDAGYEHAEPEAIELDERFEIAGEGVDVEIRSWIAGYERSTGDGLLLVASTPDATVAGQSVNPLARLSGTELVTRILETSGEGDGDLRDVEEVATEERTILGEQATVRSYEGVMDTDAGEVPIAFHLATVTHDEDVIVLLGVHPQEIDERQTQLELMETVHHGTE